MVPRCSRDRLLNGTLQVRLLCGFAVELPHQGAGLKSVLAIGDNILAGLEAGIDESLPLADLRNGHRPHLYCAVGPDHVDVRAVRTLLHSRSSDRQRVVTSFEKQ